MQSQAQRLISLYRAVVLAGVTALLMMSAALAMRAQNPAPPTATQAARMPQFASRLAHPGPRPASRSNSPARQRSRSGPPQGNDLYDNGPVNGTTDAWTINFGFVVSDTFIVPSGGAQPTGLTFYAWTFPGDVLQTAEISITSSEFGGTTYSDQIVFFNQSACSSNQLGYNVCLETSNSFNPVNLTAGTYWVNLQNAVVSDGDPLFWDENSGEGCESQGCPSQASANSVGTIPSEAFTILGETSTTCFQPREEEPATQAKAVTVPPPPTQTYRVIYNFTGGVDGGLAETGLAIDAAGNLYGTTTAGGMFGQGTAFKLTPNGSGWRFNRLYSFPVNGGFDNTLVIAPDGRLIGTSSAGGQGDGAIASLSPPGHILPSVFSNWMDTLLYSFTGGDDGANPGGSIALDSLGDIFGTANRAGAKGNGTLYEFTNGALQVLHAFPAFQGDGIAPIGVVNGSNGLYGITNGGGGNGSGTLYTTSGGYQLLYSFGPYQVSGGPVSLAADQSGNVYGTDSFRNCFAGGSNVSQFSPPSWTPVNLVSFDQIGVSSWVSTDTLGNVYGTTDYGGQYSQGNAFELTCCWNYADLHDFSSGPSDGFQPLASPVVDAQGNIYGTTFQGGTYGYGVVWEISP